MTRRPKRVATVRVMLRPTTETYLVCLHCGGFRTELAIVTGAPGSVEPAVGLHKKCLRLVREAQCTARAANKRASQAAPPPAPSAAEVLGGSNPIRSGPDEDP